MPIILVLACVWGLSLAIVLVACRHVTIEASPLVSSAPPVRHITVTDGDYRLPA